MTSADHVCLLCMRETVLPHQYPCPFCGGDDRTLPLQSPALPPRTVLDHRYVVGKTLGQGGFGITYQAYDLRMGNTVAIKEYFPSSLVGRDSSVSTTVTVNAIKGTRALDEYASGLRHFLHEARRQARLASSPGVVSVTDFFEYNNTAYYVMEFVDGCTLVKYIQKAQPMDQVLKLLEPISDSLISIHEAGLIHRDISPDNIMCAKNGQRKLLDFGASHSFTEEESTTGNATLKHGFAPPEQYGSSSMQGPWTDVYAFAATVYWCLTGKIPPDSMDRSIGGDKLRPPSALGAVITPEAEAVLMRGMALPVTARYQDMTTFWSKLKKAASGGAERLNILRSSPAFSDPDGKTTVVTMEEPEHTRVPERRMEHPAAPKATGTVEEPEHTIQPSFSTPTVPEPTMISHMPVSEPDAAIQPDLPPVSNTELEVTHDIPSVSEPDITLYRPGVLEEPTLSTESVPAVRTDNRLTYTLIGIIAVLLVVLVCIAANPPSLLPDGDSSLSENTVTIAGTTYSLDTTELYLTSDLEYANRRQPDASFTQISYLSKSDWNGICQLTGLKKLSLVDCGLSDLSGIENLSSLEVLDISGNALTDLSALENLDSLMELYAADNAFTDLAALSSLTSLVHLDLSSNQISDLTPLSELTRLNTLYLQKNQFTSITPLSGLTKITTLDLADNHLSTLEAVYPLHNLQMLYVDGNAFTNSQLLALCGRLPNCALDVDVLTDIPETVTIGSKSYSTSLTKLNLSSASLRDGDIDNLKYMVNLTELDLSGNELSDFSSISRLYGLTSLSLSYNFTTDIDFLSGLTHLETLYLSSNRIADLAPLSNLTELKNLAIGNNPISDITPLKNLTKLTLLAMCDCKADSLEPLYSLTDLFELRISKGTYSDETLDALKAVIPGCTINQY